jgi:leucine dehydrogenase
MSIFGQQDFDRHEVVHAFYDHETNLKGFVVVHSTKLGPAFGGCRCWDFDSEEVALSDALRLSRGVSYRNAIAGIPYGGGMAVIIADSRKDKTPEMFEAFGKVIENMNGTYITSEDVGTTVTDMACVAKHTKFVSTKRGSASIIADQAASTAQGVVAGMKAAVEVTLNKSNLEGLTVAIQGIGNVGYELCKQLNDQGAKLIVGDIDIKATQRAIADFGAEGIDSDEILNVEADILSPCALGGVLNAETIPWLSMKIIAGAATNQLATDNDSGRIYRRNICYVPDFVVNAGGIISVSAERDEGATVAEIATQINAIGIRAKEILSRSQKDNLPSDVVAADMARKIIEAA